jgi:hypothetical protein
MPPTTRRQSRLAGSREVVPSGIRMDSQEAEDVTMRDVDEGVCGMVEESGVGVREGSMKDGTLPMEMTDALHRDEDVEGGGALTIKIFIIMRTWS